MLFMYVCEDMCTGVQVPTEAKRALPGVGTRRGCDPHFIHAGNWTWFLCSNSMCFEPQSHLFIFKVIYWCLCRKLTALCSVFTHSFVSLTAFPTLTYLLLLVHTQKPRICLLSILAFQGLYHPGVLLSSGFVCGFSGHCSLIFIIPIIPCWAQNTMHLVFMQINCPWIPKTCLSLTHI